MSNTPTLYEKTFFQLNKLKRGSGSEERTKCCMLYCEELYNQSSSSSITLYSIQKQNSIMASAEKLTYNKLKSFLMERFI